MVCIAITRYFHTLTSRCPNVPWSVGHRSHLPGGHYSRVSLTTGGVSMTQEFTTTTRFLGLRSLHYCSYYTPQPWKRYWYNALQEMVSRKACISSQMSSEQCPMLNFFTTDDLRIISSVCSSIGSFSCTGTVSLSECFCLFGLLLGHFQPVPSLLWGLTS